MVVGLNSALLRWALNLWCLDFDLFLFCCCCFVFCAIDVWVFRYCGLVSFFVWVWFDWFSGFAGFVFCDDLI